MFQISWVTLPSAEIEESAVIAIFLSIGNSSTLSNAKLLFNTEKWENAMSYKKLTAEYI